MNPDKLFNYLDGRLPPEERAALEDQLMSDKQLQRQFAVARQIHGGMRGDSQEVTLPTTENVSEQGRKMAIRLGVAFMVLIFVNVGIGLWFIFRHESTNPNRPLLEAQMREQIAKSIERAAALTPPPNALGVTEIIISSQKGKLNEIADKVATIASELAGSATKGVPDEGRVSILVDVPANRDAEFRAALAEIQGGASPGLPAPINPPETSVPSAATSEKKSFVVQVIEKQ